MINETGKAYDEESETMYEQFNEYIMINIRTMWGINLSKVKDMFGADLYEHLVKYSRQFIANNELQEKQGTISLTEKGIMISDYIIRTLMYVP